MQPIFNRTKLIATIGPSSSDKETLLKMIAEGLDVCRLNFSHGEYEQHQKVVEVIKEINRENGLNIATLFDLQGPKIRIGTLTQEFIEIKRGDELFFTTNKQLEHQENYLFITYKNFAKDVASDDKILLDDGKIIMKVVESNGEDLVKAVVLHGDRIYPKKGVNLPNTEISLPCLTEKDLADLDFIVTQYPDCIALSFVRKASDIDELRAILESKNSNSKIIAKIEKPQALENIDEIIAATDAVMIARGDLGVEVPMEELPLTQKAIVKKCLQQAKPVIIATQIMESMVSSPQPTRAEINDAANAVLDGADALMLSGETSVGKFPIHVIRTMQRIIKKVEDSSTIFSKGDVQISKASPTYISDALCKHAARLSEETNAKAIVGMTVSGYTAFQISRHRPKAFIFVFSQEKKILSQISLVWGARGYQYNNYESTDRTMDDVNAMLKNRGLVEKGDLVINTAS
ncbi:MAG: pyruvate kinase, partial [Bacteroidetes bacterium]|nr:pyruvate kinase [Bacteroidota bacterium]